VKEHEDVENALKDIATAWHNRGEAHALELLTTANALAGPMSEMAVSNIASGMISKAAQILMVEAGSEKAVAILDQISREVLMANRKGAASMHVVMQRGGKEEGRI
jgi:hypothetical protein